MQGVLFVDSGDSMRSNAISSFIYAFSYQCIQATVRPLTSTETADLTIFFFFLLFLSHCDAELTVLIIIMHTER